MAPHRKLSSLWTCWLLHTQERNFRFSILPERLQGWRPEPRTIRKSSNQWRTSWGNKWRPFDLYFKHEINFLCLVSVRHFSFSSRRGVTVAVCHQSQEIQTCVTSHHHPGWPWAARAGRTCPERSPSLNGPTRSCRRQEHTHHVHLMPLQQNSGHFLAEGRFSDYSCTYKHLQQGLF